MENLLNLSSSNWTWVSNEGEVSATYNSDNTITITSNDTGAWGLNIAQPNLTLSAGKKYIFSCDNIKSSTWISINENENAMLKKDYGSIEYTPTEDIVNPTIKIWVETVVYDAVVFNISLTEVYTKYNTIRIKRGLKANIDRLELLPGELGVTLDTQELYVGDADSTPQLVKGAADADLSLKADASNVYTKAETDALLGGDDLPIGSIFEYDGDTVPTGYEEIEEEEKTYSTEEQKIGTWIDGKSVYRKVIKSTVEDVVSDINSIGIDTFIDIKGKAQSVYDNTWNIPNVNINASNYNIGYHIGTSDHQINLDFGSYFSRNSGVFVILEYTKITD